MTDATVTLWRVECIVPGPQEGRGPYATLPGPTDALEHLLAHTDGMQRIDFTDGNHPSLEEDGLRAIEAHELCACESVEALREWFHSGALEALTSSGYYGVVRYEVPASAVRWGRTQVLFNRTRVLRRHVVCDVSG